MKTVIIQPVKKPESFEGKRFTKADWDAAVKAGPLQVPHITALEAVRNSRGVYEIKSLEKDLPVKEVTLPDPDDMSNQALFQEMAAYGKPPRKQMARKAAIDFVRRLREEAESFIVDDEQE